MSDARFAAGLWVFAGGAEKFGGYTEALSVKQQIELAASVPGLKGLELIAPLHITPDNALEVKGWMDDAGLEPVAVNPYLWTEERWQRGAFTSPDPAVRQAAVDVGKLAIEVGHIVGTRQMCLWPGEDGWDYHFQADYGQLWEWEAEGIRQIAEFDPETRIGIEYKPHEPRTNMLVSTAAKAALLGSTLGLANVGAYLDFGHALMTGENPAESVALLSGLDRLVGVHINDNYGLGDDDIMVGAVHFWAMIEFLLALKQTNYDGWLTLDLVPQREDPVVACSQSIAAAQLYLQLLKRLDRTALSQAQADMDAVQVQRVIHEMLAGG